MRNLFFLGVIVSAVLLTSCDELMDQANVTLNDGSYSTNLSIPPAEQGNILYVQKMLESDLQQMIEDHGYSNVSVKEITITSASVEVLASSAIPNFNAVQNLNAIFQKDNVSEDTIATCVNTLTDATKLNFEPLSINVADYLGADQYGLVLKGALKEPLTDTLQVEFSMTYSVKIGL